jgi:hypothetical protein
MALKDNFRSFVDKTADRSLQATFGKLETDGTFTTEVPGRDNHVFVTYGDKDGYGGVVGISRSAKSATPSMPVLIKDRNGASTVADVDVTRLTEYTNTPNLSLVDKHTHAIGGGNVDPVEGLRFIPGLVRPFKEGGSFGLKVYVEQMQYETNNVLTWFDGSDIDLTSYVPGTADKQAWVVVGIDPSSNTPIAKSDVERDITTTMTPSQLDGFDFDGNIPLGAVILQNGQTSINTIEDFVDLRVYATSNSVVKTPSVTTITANYTVLGSDDTILVNAASGSITVTFQASAAIRPAFYIKRIDNAASTVTLNGNGANIDAAATMTLFPYESVRIQPDGSQWWIM